MTRATYCGYPFMIMWSYLILKGLAVVYSACGLAYWLAQFVSTLRVIQSVPSLEAMPETPLESYPRVSVIAPACNEADTIEAAVAMILRMICFYGKLWAVPDEKSDAAMGSGSFNLVRRAAFEKAGGFEWLKLEVADDAALGRRLKQTGARSSTAHGPGWVGVHFYNDMKTLARATERAGFTTIGNFTVWRTVLVSLIFIALDTAPFFALLPLNIPYLPFAGLAMLLIAIATLALISGWGRHPLLPTLAWPEGTFITVILLVRAGILGKRRGGIYWRGTFYPTKLLKEGKRVNFKGSLK